MSEQNDRVRREKEDAADGNNPNETYLPGQIPVEDSENYEETGPEGEERQPDPVSAEQAVNPDLAGVKERKPRV